MKTTKTQPSQSSSQPRNFEEDGQLTPALHPIAIRFEHLAETETHLRIEESLNLFGPSDFVALSDDGTTIFSAHGKGAVFGKKREIRDGSGLPIFELHASSSSLKGAWYLELPGRSHERLLSIDLLGGMSGRVSLHVHFANRYEHDGPSTGPSTQNSPPSTEAVLEVRGQDMERILFDVFYLGAKVARIRRLVSSVISRTRTGGQPLWEASVSANVDLSIITVSIIALADILLQRHPSAGALAGPGGLAG
ncbi:hypothetical protein Q7P35_009504 [Cladosporium inversicolor]